MIDSVGRKEAKTSKTSPTSAKAIKKIEREAKILEVMIGIYCHKHHKYPGNKGLCDSCQYLLDYSQNRLNNCPQIDNKPTCAKCTIHCYNTNNREEIRRVMRYSGPRMLFKRPLMAVFHLSDMLRKTEA